MPQESASVNARVQAGELTSEAGRDLLMSTAVGGYGLPPHVIQDGAGWLNDMVDGGSRCTGIAGHPAILLRPSNRSFASAPT
jgi:hypothetical protein